MQYKPLFEIPFWHGSFSKQKEAKEELLPLIKESSKNTNIPEDWKTDKLKTSFGRDDINNDLFRNHKFLFKSYYEDINKIFYHKWEGDILGLWYNYYEDGEWQEMHDHLAGWHKPTGWGQCDFTCIHFLSWKRGAHLAPIFYDPGKLYKGTSLHHTINNEFIPEINEGDFVIFPPYLQHSVPKQPSTPNYPRVTISFNLKINKYENS